MREFLASRKPTPAMAVAFIALLAALSGTAVALPGTNSVDSGDIKNKQVKSKDLANNAVTGKKVKNSSVTGADVKDQSLSPSDFSGSVQGPKGDKGDTGPAGPFPDGDVPSGKTLRGAYALEGNRQAGAGGILADEISYVFTLSAAPTTHVVPVGGPNPPECPGDVNLPQAQAGHLCVYEGQHSNAGALLIFNNRRIGSHLQVSATADGIFFATGTWAVTAQ